MQFVTTGETNVLHLVLSQISEGGRINLTCVSVLLKFNCHKFVDFFSKYFYEVEMVADFNHSFNTCCSAFISGM